MIFIHRPYQDEVFCDLPPCPPPDHRTIGIDSSARKKPDEPLKNSVKPECQPHVDQGFPTWVLFTFGAGYFFVVRLSSVFRMFNSISNLFPLVVFISAPVVTSRNVSGHCQNPWRNNYYWLRGLDIEGRSPALTWEICLPPGLPVWSSCVTASCPLWASFASSVK